eukprot:jgi/Galph1/5484/GphlegSOOS_G4105.1
MFSTVPNQVDEEQSQEHEDSVYGLGSFDYEHSSQQRFEDRTRLGVFGKITRGIKDSWNQLSQGFMEVSQKKTLKYPILLFFGDSLTEFANHISETEGVGWGSLLANVYSTKADIILRGYAGYNTRWALYLFPKILNAIDKSSLKLIVIFLGANDCTVPESPQHVDLEEYASNIFKMITCIRSSTKELSSIMLVTPPPLVEEMWKEYCEQNNRQMFRKAERVKEYVDACKKVASLSHSPCLDLWTLIREQTDWQSYFVDGLHFNEKGNRFVFEKVKDTIAQTFPHLDAATMDSVFPHWTSIDSDTYESVLEKFCSS